MLNSSKSTVDGDGWYAQGVLWAPEAEGILSLGASGK